MLHERKKKQIMKRRGIELLVLGLFAVIFFSTAAAVPKNDHVSVDIKIQSQEMVQDGEMPAFAAEVSCKNPKAVLDEKSKYTAGDLLNDLKAENGYTLSSKGDGTADGKYPIQVKLSDDIKKKMDTSWLGKVELRVEEGTLTVQNKYGTWEKDKFKKTDGTYAMDELVYSQGKTYYLNAEGVKEGKGLKEAAGAKYYFEKDGAAKTGWYEQDKDKYYFGADGRMTVGWLTVDKDSYCFDADGKMLTGKQQVGTQKCEFAKDGKLKSKEYFVDPTKPMVALTFDDGPGPRTQELLDVLEQNGARATFFMVGTNVPRYPDAVKRMEELGCEIGNHTTDHKSLTKLDPAGIQQQIGSTNDAISKIIGRGATGLRPPYGAYNDTVKANAGLPVMMWSVDTLDWKVKDKSLTLANLWKAEEKGSLDGDIVLLHDIHDWSVDAAIEAIPQLIAKGYQLVTVSEMAQARGITMEPGAKYADFYTK